ncbi:MAG TPA: hypothetical protein VEZ41_13300 [Allosphingosinicella sp.]|nr:hypothetical protein [Allosphingosinicella sp.]
MRLLLKFLALAALASPAAAQPPRVQTPEEALAKDAGEYAKNQGVSAEEAARRLRAQAESVASTDEIKRIYAGRLAGISIEHQPAFRIRVLLTGDAPVRNWVISAGGMQVPIVFETGARATGEQVVAAIYRHRDAIREIIAHDGMGHDPRTGALIVMVDRVDLGGATPDEMAARIEAVAGVPVRIRVLDRPSSDLGIGGGGRIEGEAADGKVYFCTTGFVVTDGQRDGIVTAAHCPDQVVYHGAGDARLPLQFVGGWGSQFQDVQVHVGAQAQGPVFRGSDALRPQTGQRQRARTRAGETVCHRGESSGYSCAQVDLVDYAPPGTLCGGFCHPTWVTVTGPGCRNGDSGGPVFLGATSFGILKGGNYTRDGRCNFYYYMSTDYLPPGWSLRIAGPGQPEQTAQ